MVKGREIESLAEDKYFRDSVSSSSHKRFIVAS